MQQPILEVSFETVQAVIRKEFLLASAPINVSLADLGLSYGDMVKLKAAFRRVFKMDIRMKLNDSVREITNRMRNEIQ